MKTGWEFQKLTDLGWKNSVTTMEGDKPVIFDCREHVERFVNGVRPMLQAGDYRIHEVTINE